METESNATDDLFAAVRAKITRRRQSDATTSNDESAIDMEENAFILEIKKTDNIEDPFAFWFQQKEKLPLLYNIAVDVLSVPATTAPVERVFSRASYILAKKRHNLSDEKLETELLCKFNADLVFE